MAHTEFITQLQGYLEQEDLLSVGRDVNELRSKFDDYVLEEERKLQVSQLEAEEKGEPVPEAEGDFGKEAFYEVYDQFKAKRKAQVDARNEVESKNLASKRALISQLRETVTSEENIGAAFATFKEIQEKWKEIGDIPRDKRNDIQKEYSKLLEDFFYNINIYKQLKDHDFQRNHKMKQDVIVKLKELQKEESVKKLEAELKTLQNDWDEIGPVPNEEWELMKESYWTEVRSIYNRINRFYEDRREQQRENIEKKKVLHEELKAIITDMGEPDSTKEWEKLTKDVLDIQKRWKTIGFGPKKENDEIWKEFRASCDQFFDAKKGFYDVINSKFDGVAAKKMELIEKANELKTSTDWKGTSNAIINLQKRWKQLGHAGRKNEQKLWKQFRGACDEFFDARQKHFADQDKAYEDNLTAKQEVLKKIEALKLPEDKSEALKQLKELSAEFSAIGHVPMKMKNEIYNGFKKAMDTHYGSLKMEGLEKEKVMFQAKIDTMLSSPNAGRMLNDAKYDLRKEIDKHKKEIAQLENNLGFFANSKGADALKKDVEKKVKRVEEKIALCKQKLKMIPNE